MSSPALEVASTILEQTAPPVQAPALQPGAQRKPLSKVARRVISGVIVALALVAFWPAQYGGFTGLTVVDGHSMEPTYFTGDLVVSVRQPTYQVGDVVSYLVPVGQDGAGERVIHRITEVDTSTGSPIYTTTGDNNFGAPDPWMITSKDVMGVGILSLSGFGTLIGGMSNPLLIALICGVLITVVLWSSDPRDPAKRRRPNQVGRDEAQGIATESS
jgi:signal peptidase I